MEIKINNRTFNFEISGTVGLVYIAQRLLGDDTFDSKNPYHLVVLYYAAFFNSNRDIKDLPDLQTFVTSMTSPLLNTISTYFWDRWNELEGEAPEEAEEAEKGEN